MKLPVDHAEDLRPIAKCFKRGKMIIVDRQHAIFIVQIQNEESNDPP